MSAPAGGPRGYDADWALFLDWCAVAGRAALPANGGTVTAFLTEITAAPATAARRCAAIDHRHRAAGLPAPGTELEVRRWLRRARGLVEDADPRLDPDVVSAALARIAVQGWPEGVRGRRDAAVLALSGAGMTRRQLRALTTAAVDAGALESDEDPGSCRRCALTRWLRVHEVAGARGWSWVRRSMASRHLELAGEQEHHDCARPLEPMIGIAPLLPSLDRHGWPGTAGALSARSLSTIALRSLEPAPRRAGYLDEAADPRDADPLPAATAAAAPAVRDRSEDVAALADVGAVFDDVEAQIDEAMRRLDDLMRASD